MKNLNGHTWKIVDIVNCADDGYSGVCNHNKCGYLVCLTCKVRTRHFHRSECDKMYSYLTNSNKIHPFILVPYVKLYHERSCNEILIKGILE